MGREELLVFWGASLVGGLLAVTVRAGAAECYDVWAYGFVLEDTGLDDFVPVELEVKIPPVDPTPPYLITSTDGRLRLILERAP